MSMIKEWLEAYEQLDEAGKDELKAAFESLQIEEFAEEITTDEGNAKVAMIQHIQGHGAKEEAFCEIVCPKYFKVSAWDKD